MKRFFHEKQMQARKSHTGKLIYGVVLALQSVVCIKIQSYLKNAEFFTAEHHKAGQIEWKGDYRLIGFLYLHFVFNFSPIFFVYSSCMIKLMPWKAG